MKHVDMYTFSHGWKITLRHALSHTQTQEVRGMAVNGGGPALHSGICV